jgi:predicted  nucleic acid-binding Zn-ribbon protein
MNTIARLENQINELDQAVDLLRRLGATYHSEHFRLALAPAIQALLRQSNELQYEISDLYDKQSESHDR